ncbi:MAG: hypothetical protein RR995_01725 [Hungatella sp.]
MNRRAWIGKKQVACMALGILCYLLTVWSEGRAQSLQNGYLKRNSYGEGQAQYDLQVKGLGEELYPLTVELEERVYGAEEASKVFEQVMAELGEQILGDNVSLMEVRSDLNLISALPQKGVQIRWSSGDPELLDSFGHICAEDLAKEGRETYVSAHLLASGRQAEYQIRVWVYPPDLTEKEALAAGLKKQILGLEKGDRTGEGVWLPTEYDGKQLHYREQTDSHPEILLVLGVVLAFLCHAQDQYQKEEKKRARDRELMFDYAEVIFKLMVFIGAGMTVSMAWERLVLDYRDRCKRGRMKTRAVYEEMERSVQQMKSGISEGQAYVEFGRRCQLQPYLKLSSMLEQNRKTGTKNLSSLLSAEMAEAWEQRKTIAKRMGEEAGTRLLLPLFMMLGIVMVMIMVPAMLSMQ